VTVLSEGSSENYFGSVGQVELRPKTSDAAGYAVLAGNTAKTRMQVTTLTGGAMLLVETQAPTGVPSGQPSMQPSSQPTGQPSGTPSAQPSSSMPSNQPTSKPTPEPTLHMPTPAPTQPDKIINFGVSQGVVGISKANFDSNSANGDAFLAEAERVMGGGSLVAYDLTTEAATRRRLQTGSKITVSYSVSKTVGASATDQTEYDNLKKLLKDSIGVSGGFSTTFISGYTLTLQAVTDADFGNFNVNNVGAPTPAPSVRPTSPSAPSGPTAGGIPSPTSESGGGGGMMLYIYIAVAVVAGLAAVALLYWFCSRSKAQNVVTPTRPAGSATPATQNNKPKASATQIAPTPVPVDSAIKDQVRHPTPTRPTEVVVDDEDVGSLVSWSSDEDEPDEDHTASNRHSAHNPEHGHHHHHSGHLHHHRAHRHRHHGEHSDDETSLALPMELDI
jgi:hypothetical protein